MRIDNLTKEDVQILDTIWDIETVEELDTYLKTLNAQQLIKTLTLIELCQLADTDDTVNAMDEYPEAEAMLKGIMN